MDGTPSLIHSAAAVRAADRHAIEVLGIPGYALMQRAAGAALEALDVAWPTARRILVLCGAGNNGGDGYVLARLAAAAGHLVTVVAPGGAPSTGDAVQAAADWRAAGGTVVPWTSRLPDLADVIVDGLFGTGLTRDLAAPWLDIVRAVNAADRPILALDIPTGLDAESGAVHGALVHAALTVTFVGLKPGLYLGQGPEATGRIVLADLGVPAAAFASAAPVLRRIGPADWRAVLPRRPRMAHKGSNGRVLVIAGGEGMPGAALLAGSAALRAGAGLVTVATFPGHAAAIAAARPELICRGVADADALGPMLAAADVIAVGPGLGRTPWAEALVQAAFAAAAPLVVDADALNSLAGTPVRRERWCLTPHPGEAARLLGTNTGAVQADRLAAVHALAGQFNAVVVLKGAATLVAAGGAAPFVCERGNPGMAVAGMGDVLTGVIAALAAQQPDPAEGLGRAAVVGVDVHATAGDRAAAARGERGLLAGDLIDELPACVNLSR